jgi:hypothetical protein
MACFFSRMNTFISRPILALAINLSSDQISVLSLLSAAFQFLKYDYTATQGYLR